MKWTRQTKVNEVPTVYQSEDGETVQFKAGEEPWTYIIMGGTTVSKKKALEVIEEADTQGFLQHDYEGGYEEATKTLEV